MWKMQKENWSDLRTSCNSASYEITYISYLFRQCTIRTANILLKLVMENKFENSVYKCYS